MLSIVIPAYNEGRRISKTLERIISYVHGKQIQTEILVIDDGSADDTAEIVSSFSRKYAGMVRLIRLPDNKGKGYAVRTGLEASVGERVLFSDADLATPIEALDLLLPWIQDDDVVIGSRKDAYAAMGGAQALKRKVVHILGRYVRRSFMLRDIRDTQCGFKLLTRNAIRRIHPKGKIDGYAFDMEMLVIARTCGLHIHEIEVPWNHDIGGTFKLGRASLSVLRDLVRIKLNQISGTYKDRY